MREMLVALLCVAACVAPAAAQKGPFGLGQDLRLDGIVDPGAPAKGSSLGTIKIRAGKTVRTFGVIRAQTARAEGMSLFNRSSLHPEQLLLRGPKGLLETFRHAPAGTRLSMLGRYSGDDYLLAELTVVGGSATPSATGRPQ